MDNKQVEHKTEHSVGHEGHAHDTEHAKKGWYDRYYKLMLIVPALLLLFSLFYLFNFYRAQGDVIYKDVSLTGGTTVTVFDTGADINALEQSMKAKFPDLHARAISDIRTGEQHGFFVETQAGADEVKKALEDYLGYALTQENSSIEFSGSSISQGFYQQLRIALIASFVLMALVVFIIFRTPIRSLSVIIAGLFDIIMTIVVVDILHIQLSTAGIVALLMLIGYSVDVDILLTTRVVKDKEGTLNQRIFGAFKTGITMTLTAIAAAAVALVFTHSLSPALAQMFTIILIGLGFDMLNCWVTNASMLKWYMEVKKIE
jgi:preprotein translocase subunit SecF